MNLTTEAALTPWQSLVFGLATGPMPFRLALPVGQAVGTTTVLDLIEGHHRSTSGRTVHRFGHGSASFKPDRHDFEADVVIVDRAGCYEWRPSLIPDGASVIFAGHPESEMGFETLLVAACFRPPLRFVVAPEPSSGCALVSDRWLHFMMDRYGVDSVAYRTLVQARWSDRYLAQAHHEMSRARLLHSRRAAH